MSTDMETETPKRETCHRQIAREVARLNREGEEWAELGRRHATCCDGVLADAIEHDHADARKLNVSHVARAIVELIGDNEPFAKDHRCQWDMPDDVQPDSVRCPEAATDGIFCEWHAAVNYSIAIAADAASGR